MSVLRPYETVPDYVRSYIDNVIKIEGGYVNDPSDSGGETNFGITKKTALKYAYRDDMRFLPESVAKDIYAEIFWLEPKLFLVSDLSKIISEEIFDTSVNTGSVRAIKFLQRSLNVFNNKQQLYPDIEVDGIMGSNTKKSLKAFLDRRGSEGESVLLNTLNCLQGAFYVELSERREKDEKFTYGWMLHRVKLSNNT